MHIISCADVSKYLRFILFLIKMIISVIMYWWWSWYFGWWWLWQEWHMAKTAPPPLCGKNHNIPVFLKDCFPYFWFLAVHNSSKGDLVPLSGTTNNQSLHNTTEWPLRLVTFETFDRSDEKTWPDQKYLHTYPLTYLTTYLPTYLPLYLH